LHERPPVHHEEAGHGKLTAKKAKEIYASAVSASAATH
jgi:hypothetical protein